MNKSKVVKPQEESEVTAMKLWAELIARGKAPKYEATGMPVKDYDNGGYNKRPAPQ